jgi:hypothetical protein
LTDVDIWRQTMSTTDIREHVRERYAEAARAATRADGCGCGCGDAESGVAVFGEGLYEAE